MTETNVYPILGESNKVLTKTYTRLRNSGLYNKSSLTDEEYSYANLTRPQGEGPYDENDIFKNIRARNNKKLSIEDFPKND